MKPAHLVVLAPGAAPRNVPLLDGVTTIGSGLQAHVRLADPEVAPLHAEIESSDAGWVLVRHASPTLVNGRKSRRYDLAPSDLITLGRSALALREGRVPESQTVPSTIAPSAVAAAAATASSTGSGTGSSAGSSSLSRGASGTSATASGARSLLICRRLYEFTRRLSSGDGAEGLADQLLADVVELTGADRGLLVLHEGDDFRAAAGRTSALGTFDPRETQLSRTVMARILEERRPLLFSDPHTDADLGLAPSVFDAQIRSLMCAPIQDGERLVGALYVSRSETPGAFDADALDLVTIYANQAQLCVQAISRGRLAEERAAVAEQRLSLLRQPAIIGSSDRMQALLRDVQKVSTSAIPVLLQGETGTGKEVLAREIHRLSPRADKPFVAVHCGAIPEQLLESELFGHVRGAFTDAQQNRTGRIRAADGGTLFLDEIGEMPLAQQAKLLRVLEDRFVQPVGGDVSYQIDFRLIAATNQDLEKYITGGKFRRDLFFRVAGIPLVIPPLRERGDDAVELAQHFLRRHRVMLSRPAAHFSAGALTAIRTARWDGNVRELEAAVRRALVLADGDLIEAAAFGGPPGDDVPAAGDGSAGLVALKPLDQARDEYLKEYVRQAVERLGGNRTAAARALSVSPRTIFKYLDEI